MDGEAFLCIYFTWASSEEVNWIKRERERKGEEVGGGVEGDTQEMTAQAQNRIAPTLITAA